MFRFPTLRWALASPGATRLPTAPAGCAASRWAPLKALIRTGAGLIGLALLFPWHLGSVRGTSMAPTLQPGSLFLYERGHLRPDQLRRGDIVILRHAGELWIKRVYARAGDLVLFWHEYDGTTIRRIPIPAADLPRYERLAGWLRRHGPTRVRMVRQAIPAGHVFVLGDNATTSVDSRTVGAISAAQIVGRVIPLPGQNLARPPDVMDKVALAL